MRKPLLVVLLLGVLSVSPVLPVFVHSAQAITQSQANQIKKGMTQAQVRKALGSPKFTNTYKGVTMWTYSMGNSFLGVHFRNGKVIKWGNLDG